MFFVFFLFFFVFLFYVFALSEAFSVVGGGDTTVIIERLYLDHYIEFISTGGGAMLEFLCGQKLPGLLALAKK